MNTEELEFSINKELAERIIKLEGRIAELEEQKKLLWQFIKGIDADCNNNQLDIARLERKLK